MRMKRNLTARMEIKYCQNTTNKEKEFPKEQSFIFKESVFCITKCIPFLEYKTSFLQRSKVIFTKRKKHFIYKYFKIFPLIKRPFSCKYTKTLLAHMFCLCFKSKIFTQFFVGNFPTSRWRCGSV